MVFSGFSGLCGLRFLGLWRFGEGVQVVGFIAVVLGAQCFVSSKAPCGFGVLHFHSKLKLQMATAATKPHEPHGPNIGADIASNTFPLSHTGPRDSLLIIQVSISARSGLILHS